MIDIIVAGREPGGQEEEHLSVSAVCLAVRRARQILVQTWGPRSPGSFLQVRRFISTLYLYLYSLYFAPEWPGRCSRSPSWPTRTLSTGGRSLTSTGSSRTSWTRFVTMRIEYDGWSLCFCDNIIIYCCNKEVICLRENSLKNINTTASGDSAKIQHSRHIRHANKHQFHLCQSDAGECWSLIRDRISYFWFISPKMSCPHKHCRMWREGTPLRQRGRPRIFMPVTSVLVSSYLYLYHQDYITL